MTSSGCSASWPKPARQLASTASYFSREGAQGAQCPMPAPVKELPMMTMTTMAATAMMTTILFTSCWKDSWACQRLRAPNGARHVGQLAVTNHDDIIDFFSKHLLLRGVSSRATRRSRRQKQRGKQSGKRNVRRLPLRLSHPSRPRLQITGGTQEHGLSFK